MPLGVVGPELPDPAKEIQGDTEGTGSFVGTGDSEGFDVTLRVVLSSLRARVSLRVLDVGVGGAEHARSPELSERSCKPLGDVSEAWSPAEVSWSQGPKHVPSPAKVVWGPIGIHSGDRGPSRAWELCRRAPSGPPAGMSRAWGAPERWV